MVDTIKISEMTDAGNFKLGQVAPVLDAGLNAKTTVQLQFDETGTTAQRPVAPADPTIRYNTDFQQFEYWNGAVWGQLGSDNDVAALIARLAAHTMGDGASMIGLLDQGAVLNKTVQDFADADFLVKTDTTSLVNGFAIGTLATGFLSVQTATGDLVSRTMTGAADQIDVTNGTGLAGNTQFSISANPQLSGTSNLKIPFGTTAQRPGLPTSGMIRYNTTDNVFEYYNTFTASWDQVSTTGGTVASVSGTLNRITSTGGANPVIDISASYVGQTSITTLGTIGTGIWQGTIVSPIYGGTGVNNGASTLTLAGNLATAGAFASTFTMTGATSVTFPTSGTLATTAQLPTPAALSKTDDTNVTLTLGGSPLTALLQATSLTLGWTGTLAVGRGGLGISTTPANGQIPIGNGTNYTAATLTAGTGMAITNGAGSITLDSTAFTQVVIQVFGADGTYTPTTGMKYCIVEALGGGGGGGGAQTTSAVQVAAAGGGGAGGYQRSVFSAATIGASKAVDIGAGGGGGAAGNNNGTAGSATTLGTTLIVANGGAGGSGAAATGTSATVGGGTGGAAGTGTLFIAGQAGQAGIGTYNATTYNVTGGAGGDSFFGPGGRATFRLAISGANNPGSVSGSQGCGGGGASNTISCADTAGGAGTAGYMIITEFI